MAPKRSSFPIEEEINKLPINIRIDDNGRICPGCIRKLRRKKAIEENLQEAIRDLVKNYSPSALIPLAVPIKQYARTVGSVLNEFVPLLNSSPKKQTVSRSNGLEKSTSCQAQNRAHTEPGVTVNKFASPYCLVTCFNLFNEHAKKAIYLYKILLKFLYLDIILFYCNTVLLYLVLHCVPYV